MSKSLSVVYFFCILICALKCDLLTYRLSSDEAIPKNYLLAIQPDLDNEVFDGEVTIYVQTTKSLEGITLHSKDLNISAVYINQIRGHYEEQNEDKIILKYNSSYIQPGEHAINIKYSGKIGFPPGYGFIKAVYEDKDVKAYVYVTDLEPTRARMVFPCFDEPVFKANFHVFLISPNDTFKAISNMPEINKFSTIDGGTVYQFASTVKMSTYLVSFAFTNFPYYEEILEYKGRNIPIRIYTVNASRENNAFAINATKLALNFYSDYTNISYPLPKLDMIEYKRNESAATENWGLITFREGLLTTSLGIYTKSQIKLVAFHELSHFWFGNLVTNAWWNDIWLQEGFATYFSYKLSAFYNNQKQLDEMKSFTFNDFFETEIYEHSNPIITYLPQQKDIPGVFNSLVYEKASAILLMLEDHIGEDKFREVVRRYLSKYAYSTATTNDFITTLEEVVTNIPLRSFLESYLYNSKFPVIEVDIRNDSYVLRQQPCETFVHETRRPSKWTIPLTYQTDNSSQIKKIWFYKDMKELIIHEPDAKWLIFNPQGNGLYKAIWSQNLWERIVDHFELMDLTTTDTVISDAFYSFRMSKIGCDVLIRLMERVRESDKRKWYIFFAFNDHLRENLFCHKHVEEIKLFWSFLLRRFVETGYLRHPELKEPESCDNEFILKNDEYNKNLKKCAAWIQQNLQEKNVNVVKRKL